MEFLTTSGNVLMSVTSIVSVSPGIAPIHTLFHKGLQFCPALQSLNSTELFRPFSPIALDVQPKISALIDPVSISRRQLISAALSGKQTKLTTSW